MSEQETVAALSAAIQARGYVVAAVIPAGQGEVGPIYDWALEKGGLAFRFRLEVRGLGADYVAAMADNVARAEKVARARAAIRSV